MAAPMPGEPPVTSAVRPRKRCAVMESSVLEQYRPNAQSAAKAVLPDPGKKAGRGWHNHSYGTISWVFAPVRRWASKYLLMQL
jgi:hypothetical protein